MQRKLLNILYTGFFSTVMLGTSLGTAVYFDDKQALSDVTDKATLMDGKMAKQTEAVYDNALLVKQVGVNFWTALQYRLFSEANDGLLIGRDGWLFSTEEFVVPGEAEQALKNNLAFIRWTHQQLTDQGVTLLVTLLPAKARVLEEYTGRHQPAQLHQRLYSQALTTLQGGGVNVIDTLAAFRAEGSADALYLKTDTHWTPQGAQKVALQAASDLKVLQPELQLSVADFVTDISGTTSHRGDLLNFLPLSPWFDDLMPAQEPLQVMQTYQRGDVTAVSDALFGESLSAPEVALIGTSYSADSKWNFAGALKQHLASDVINLAEEGRGPVLPMLNFLQQQFTSMPELKIVVWEIPERYLLRDYSSAYAAMSNDLKVPEGQLEYAGVITTNVSAAQ